MTEKAPLYDDLKYLDSVADLVPIKPSPVCPNADPLSRAICLERLHDALQQVIASYTEVRLSNSIQKGILLDALAVLISARLRSLYRDFVAPLAVRRCQAVRTAQIDPEMAEFVEGVRKWRRDWDDWRPARKR